MADFTSRHGEVVFLMVAALGHDADEPEPPDMGRLLGARAVTVSTTPVATGSALTVQPFTPSIW
ncbi:hypothetical protein J2848_003752 [Azospirillum lipoferum]|uniref:Uncharacterized protein n=1 Tax=Azospirillum lipoferum TaxID=193 RepID=A0A5A9GC53_AZOLI|nr:MULTISPECIES: hypothetical protein [Azospirillum]KAA0592050.1 hypothetical protein FZ942_29600 [Azospirillum lipoferum]MCP1612072.1 hypothetical protein [Azospirillum lipoferum]MDW5536700.1 hypothetical protein [Azospirillum sp. NL1]